MTSLPRCAVLTALACLPLSARAQTDFYNLDRGRPLQIEDAYAIERHSLEFQAAPLRLERAGRGRALFGIEPELAWGFLPRTHLEVGLPLATLDRGALPSVTAAAGLDVELLHNVNAETEGLPALGVAVGALLPMGGFGPSRTVPSARLMATRTFSGARRLHINVQRAFGPDLAATAGGPAGPSAMEVPRWLAGAAMDVARPLASLVMGVETFAMRPLDADGMVEWSSGVGARYQLDPRWVLDVGGGRRWRGELPAWYLTVGGAYAFGKTWLIPGGAR